MSKNLWVLDPVHSEITFKVRHMMITNVSGVFQSFSGSMNSSAADFTDAEISFEADIESITTRNEQRDEHLRSSDFFEAQNYPKLKFTSSSFVKESDSNYKMSGILSFRGEEKAIDLEVIYRGTVIDPWGNVKAGFEINGSILRKDFNLNWNATNDTGVAVLSDDVKLLISAQLVRQI
jgi:polyisoprenoid-binding protein YceI